jgi:hypothetical protein
MIQEWGAVFLLLLLTATAWPHGFEYALSPLAYLLLLVVSLLLRSAQERTRIRFFNQLKSSRKELRHGGSVLVDGLVLHYHSVVTTYRYVIGGLFFSVLIPSRFRSTDRSSSAEAYLSALCSVFTGWWSIPHGPLVTVVTALQNLHGGEKIFVAELIDGARRAAEEDKKPKKKPKPEKPARTKAETGPGSRSQRHLEDTPYPSGWRPLNLSEKKRARRILAKVFDVPPGEEEDDESPKPHPSKLPEQAAKKAEIEKRKKEEAAAKPGKLAPGAAGKTSPETTGK